MKIQKKKQKRPKTERKKETGDELLFQLDGNVFLIEKKDGKIVSKETIDGNTVLNCLLYVLEYGITNLERK